MPLRLSVCFRNFKLEKGHDYLMKPILTTALNCESICPVFKASIWLFFLRKERITVAQQPVICTRFLFNHPGNAG